MFEKIFGSKPQQKPTEVGKPIEAPVPRPSPPKMRRVNLDRRFSIIAETSQGSMSRVSKALDNEKGRTVCLKVQDRAKSAAAAARTSQKGRMSEGEIGMQIIHPRVVRTFEYGETTRGDYYIVMEFIDGVSLTHVRQTRVLTLPQRVEFLAQAAEGLAAVHEAGFIHHDFGPKNLLVDRNDQVKLIDFGLAVPNTAEFRRPGNRTGTLQYMAPELIRREATDERLDIFSWGVTAFEFLTSGKQPYDASVTEPMVMMRLRINAEPSDITRFAPHLPEDLRNLVNKALARDPKERWPSMRTMAEALRALPLMEGYVPPEHAPETPFGDPLVSAGIEPTTAEPPARRGPSVAEPAPESVPRKAVEPDSFVGGPSDPAEEDFLAALGLPPEPGSPEAPASAAPASPQPRPQSEREPIPKEVRRQVWERDQGRCATCGGEEGLKFQRLTAPGRGVEIRAEDIRILCRPCRHALRAKKA